MKKLDYSLARVVTKITGIVFAVQIVIALCAAQRHIELGLVFYVCLTAFVISLLYSSALIVINALFARRE